MTDTEKVAATAVTMEDVNCTICEHHVMDTTAYKRRHPAFAIIQQLTVNMSTSLEKKMEELMR